VRSLLVFPFIIGDIFMSSFSMTKFTPAGRAYEVDPVCEMRVNPQQPPYKAVYQGKAYYFCSEACKLLFERMPEKYIKEMKG
jgi:YHS domain-containing protein